MDDLDTVLFIVDEETFEQLEVALDAPPLPNPGLERLMSVPVPWAAAPR